MPVRFLPDELDDRFHKRTLRQFRNLLPTWQVRSKQSCQLLVGTLFPDEKMERLVRRFPVEQILMALMRLNNDKFSRLHRDRFLVDKAFVFISDRKNHLVIRGCMHTVRGVPDRKHLLDIDKKRLILLQR